MSTVSTAPRAKRSDPRGGGVTASATVREICLASLPVASLVQGFGTVVLGGRAYEVQPDGPAHRARYWHLRASTVD